ncbi:MAG: bifunctional homocysteine S-methyltransferase/methylenetetrahydrofolate reductase [Spirochaetales bacterium]
MRKPYLERLNDGVLLFDGAMATYLYTKGVYLKKCFEEVCMTHPQLVLDVHREYIARGAQAIETNTYGANPLKLRGWHLSEKTEAINASAVRLARQAAGDEVYVAGSVGPTGQATLGPEARASFEAHIGALVRAGVDLILLETFQNREELTLAVEVARGLSPDLPIQAQFTFARAVFSGEDYYRTEAEAWAQLLQTLPVDVVGVNLMGPADALEALSILKKHLTKPVIVMPDSGMPKEIDGRQFYTTTPDSFAEYAKLFVDAGAAGVGGCCGTTPEFIEKAGQAILSFDAGRRQVKWVPSAPEVVEQPQAPLAERSALGAALAHGEWIETVELVAPLGVDASAVVQKARDLEAGGVKFVNLPDGPRASARLSALMTASLIARATQLEPILHLACRDKNLIGLQGDLFGYHADGLRNVLLVTGDPPKVGKYPNVTGVFDVDSIGLTKIVRRFNGGVDMGAEALPQKTSFVHGTGVNPEFPVMEKELERARQKAEAGTEYFITQPVWDLAVLEKFLLELNRLKVPVLLGVWPLASYRNALFLNTEVPGVHIPQNVLDRMARFDDKEAARREGIAISREIIARFRPLIQGLQVSPPFGNVKTALETLAP